MKMLRVRFKNTKIKILLPVLVLASILNGLRVGASFEVGTPQIPDPPSDLFLSTPRPRVMASANVV